VPTSKVRPCILPARRHEIVHDSEGLDHDPQRMTLDVIGGEVRYIGDPFSDQSRRPTTVRIAPLANPPSTSRLRVPLPPRAPPAADETCALATLQPTFRRLQQTGDFKEFQRALREGRPALFRGQ
jgi:hypothetical protein